MIALDGEDIREQLIQDIVEKRRKTKEVSLLLWIGVRAVEKRVWRYKHYGKAGIARKKPWPKESTPYNRTSDEIEGIVCLYGQKYKREWPKMLKRRLKEACGIELHEVTIYRILKRNRVRYQRGYEKPRKSPKMYSLSTPWEEVQVDTWYPFGYHRKFVVYSAIDDCTRMTYSKAYEHANLESTKDFMEELIRRYPYDIQRIRTDQWREFSKTISEFLKERHIEHVKNEPYHPEHNGKIERYHLTEKEWEVRFRPYLIGIEEANYMLSQRLGYYNTKRRHSWLWMDGKTPREKYEENKHKKRT